MALTEIIGYQGESTLFSLVKSIRDDFSEFAATWIEAVGAIFVDENTGEVNLFVNLRSMLDDWYTDIENATNPMSEDNIDDFNASVESLTQDTFIGDIQEVSSGADEFITQLNGVSPNAHIYINTLPVSFFGANIPAKRIDVNMEWYAAYRTQTFSILRAFIYLGYIILLWRNLPSILGGVSPLLAQNEPLDIPQENYSVTMNDDGSVRSAYKSWSDGNVHYRQKM